MFRILMIITAMALFFASCRSTRNIHTAIAKKDTADLMVVSDHGHDDSLRFINEIFAGIHNRKINFTTFSAKIKVDYTGTDNKKYDVNVFLRMYRDSIIWISVNAILGIEAVRVYITKDSLKLLDKQNKTYIARSVDYLREITELPLDLGALQELVIGNPVFLDSNIVSYSSNGTAVSLLSHGEWFRNLITVSGEDNAIQHSKIDDMDNLRNRTCYLSYSEYENKKGVNFSVNRAITVSEKSKLDVRLDFRQYEFNESLSFPFSVPKNYKAN